MKFVQGVMKFTRPVIVLQTSLNKPILKQCLFVKRLKVH